MCVCVCVCVCARVHPCTRIRSFHLILDEMNAFTIPENWFYVLICQGTLKSLLQHHRSKASILWCSAFFIVQFSHPYMTTGKTIALTRQTFVGKVMSLLFNMLSRLVITFFPRSKPLLISWLQSPSAVILEPQKIKSDTISRSTIYYIILSGLYIDSPCYQGTYRIDETKAKPKSTGRPWGCQRVVK